jgi:PTN/MK family heparin-binding protein
MIAHIQLAVRRARVEARSASGFPARYRGCLPSVEDCGLGFRIGRCLGPTHAGPKYMRLQANYAPAREPFYGRSQKDLESNALAGGATSPSTDWAIKADTMVFMTLS